MCVWAGRVCEWAGGRAGGWVGGCQPGASLMMVLVCVGRCLKPSSCPLTLCPPHTLHRLPSPLHRLHLQGEDG